MRNRILCHPRPRSAVYIALGVLIGAGGSYALAAGNARTITVCADKGTGVVHLKTHGRCKRGQTRVSWNQAGPQGPQGKQGVPGTPAVSIWAAVGSNAVAGFVHGLSVQHVSPGVFRVTVTNPACAQAVENAPWVSVLEGSPPAGYGAGAFPEAWATAALSGQFTVYTGVASSGTFTLSDRGFNVYDAC